MNDYFLLLAAAAAVLAYWNIRSRVADFMQPIRLDVLARSEALIARNDFPEPFKERLEFVLDNIYSARLAWTFALTYLPASIFFGFRRLFVKTGHVSQKNFPHKKEYNDIMRLGVFSIMSSSPLAFVILAASTALTLALFLPLPRLFNGILDSKFVRSLFHDKHGDDHKDQRVASC
jgi:hypothetical protein